MMSKISPQSFMVTLSLVSLGASLACRYEPGLAYVPTPLPSYASINKFTIKDSKDAVGMLQSHLALLATINT